MRLTGAEIIWESLQKEGCDLVFGYPGGAILPTYDALSKYPQVHHVLTRHEQGATHMADGYARATGKVGVVMATSRAGRHQPGDRHRHRDHGLLPDRRDHRAGAARRDRQRRVPGDRRHRHHAADHQAQLPGGRRARPGGDACARRSTSRAPDGRARSWSTFPRTCRSPPPSSSTRPSRSACAATVRSAPRRASRSTPWPSCCARRGVRSSSPATACVMSGAVRELREFAEKMQIPIALTLLGKGAISEHHPLCLGMMGMHGEAYTNNAIQEADLLLAFGMRFDDRVTGNLETYAKKSRKIHIDIDPSEINKNVKVDVGIAGDLRAVLQQLIPVARREADPAWMARIKEWKKETTARDIIHEDAAGQAARRARHPRSVALHRRRRHHRHRRRPAPDVGGAVLPARAPAHAHHLGRPRHHGLRPARGDRRQDGPAGRRGVGDRRRRRLPDDDGGARHRGAGKGRRQDRDHQQRLPRAWSASGRSSSTRSATTPRR